MTQKVDAQATLGEIIGGITGLFILFAMVYWFDCGLWTSLIVSLLAGAVIGAMVDASIPEKSQKKKKDNFESYETEFENWEDIADKAKKQESKKEQVKITLTILKWGVKWGGMISAFLILMGMLADDWETPIGIILVSFVLLTAFIGFSLALIRLVWRKIKETIERRKKENSIIAHFKNMPKPRRKVIAGPPQKDDDFNLPGYGVAVWKSSKGVPINFNYVDASGDYSERTVIIHEMTKDSKTRFYFHGYCLLRRAERTFNSENIQDIYDMNGEIIEIPDFINTLAGYKAYGSTEVKSIKKKK